MMPVLTLALISLGINQTVLLSAIPTLVEWVGQSDSAASVGLLVAMVNMNLVSYWLGAGWWGGVAEKLGFGRAIRLASCGYIVANLSFICLLLLAPGNIWLIGVCRFAIGGFSSAFLPLSQAQLAAQGKATPGALSALSGGLTIGRLAGPALVLLPVSIPVILLVPIALVVPVLFMALPGQCHASGQSAQLARPSEERKARGQSGYARVVYSAALLTTGFVAAFQLYVLQFITSHGYEGEEGSKVYALMMLATSVLLVVYQLRVIPKISRSYSSALLPVLLLSLVIGWIILVTGGANWWGLFFAVVGLLLAVAGLPAWYTSRLLERESEPARQAKSSGYLTRSHTTGHMVGTGLASLFLHQQWSLSVLISALVLLLLFTVLKLRKNTESGTCSFMQSN
ncbi:MFS transporter [Vibrio sp. ABG19]|uniref:MFS transporter n=1 Tax=Vibrio sp. ABG19 TaxID=2817385 RepID=UPI00249E2A12|nr:MFS transporter [Vibrio sp. ABG19]WGY46628.1 hypothetical protein J0X00_17660 [Vibrio sp. ABG19]